MQVGTCAEPQVAPTSVFGRGVEENSECLCNLGVCELCVVSASGGMCDPRSRISLVASTCRYVLVLSHKWRLCVDTMACVGGGREEEGLDVCSQHWAGLW
jgi:hypothetical protein